MEEDQAAGVLDYGAVQLFLSAAKRVKPNYEPDKDELVDVVRICHQVSGMPLGIILATAWLGMLSPAEIAEEIEKSLDFLVVEWPDLPARQRSLRATLDYTWRLLSPAQQETFQALSVFRGGLQS